MTDALAEIKHLYHATTRATIHRDFDRAIDVLKSMPSEEERERATVYMQGLAEMKRRWRRTGQNEERRTKNEERNKERRTRTKNEERNEERRTGTKTNEPSG